MRQLLDFSRTSGDNKNETVSLHQLIPEVVQLFSAQKKCRTIHFEERLEAEDDLIRGDSDGLRQVLMNCLLNSVDAIMEVGRDPGVIRISTANGPNSTVCIRVWDNGTGLGDEQVRNLFDPFFTTKEPGKGTGLGPCPVGPLPLSKTWAGTISAATVQGEWDPRIRHLELGPWKDPNLEAYWIRTGRTTERTQEFPKQDERLDNPFMDRSRRTPFS